MAILLVCAIVILLVLVTLALSQASDVNKRLNSYLRELNRIEGLESRLGKLERELGRLGEGGGAAVQTRPPAAESAPPTTTTDGTAQPAGPGTPAGTTAAPRPIVPPGRAVPQGETPPATLWTAELPKPSKSRAEWEAFVGGKLLNRIGAFALILGVGFFLKYAFDNEWISETLRVLIGAAAGLVCLAVARSTHRKGMAVFAQGLVGSGIAILYLSVYASFNYYFLVPQWAAFLLMSAVTALAFAQGVTYDSLAVGLLGWAGGFLTPFMLSAGEPNEVGLFGYVAMLDAAIIALTLRKRGWAVLSPLAMAATWLVYHLWHSVFFADAKLATALVSISIFWLLFHAADAARGARPLEWWPAVRHIIPTVNVGLFYVAMYDILERGHHEWTAPATLVLAGLYLATSLAARRNDPQPDADRARNIVTLSVLVVIATSVQYAGYATTVLWSIEAAALAWCGARWKYDYLLTCGLILFFIAGVKLVGTEGALYNTYPGEIGPVTNLRNIAYLVYAAALAVGARQSRKSTGPTAQAFAAWLGSASAAVIILAATVTVNDIFSFAQSAMPPDAAHDLMFRRLMALGCTWMVCSIPYVWTGLATGRSTMLVPGLAALLLAVTLVTIRGAAFHPIEIFRPGLNVRVMAFAVVLCGIAVHSALIDSYRGVRDWLPDVRSYLGLAAGIAFFSLLTGETRDLFGKMLADQPPAGAPGYEASRIVELQNLRQLSISGIWLAYSAVLLAVGIWKGSKGLRFFSIGLLGLTILKIFIYDLSFLETLYRIFSFIGLGLILLAASYAYQRYKGILFGGHPEGAAPRPSE